MEINRKAGGRLRHAPAAGGLADSLAWRLAAPGACHLQQAWLEQFSVTPGVTYIAVTGGLVGAAAALAFWALAAGYRWAPAATRIIVTVLALGYWADRLLFTQSSAAWANWPSCLC